MQRESTLTLIVTPNAGWRGSSGVVGATPPSSTPTPTSPVCTNKHVRTRIRGRRGSTRCTLKPNRSRPKSTNKHHPNRRRHNRSLLRRPPPPPQPHRATHNLRPPARPLFPRLRNPPPLPNPHNHHNSTHRLHPPSNPLPHPPLRRRKRPHNPRSRPRIPRMETKNLVPNRNSRPKRHTLLDLHIRDPCVRPIDLYA